jgi:CRP-like cAMP-binding protein
MPNHPFQSFVVRFGPGDRIFTEGDVGATMYIVQSGKVRLFRSLDGQNRVLGVMEKGDFFGEMSILEGLPRTASAEADGHTELIEINSTTFDKMIRGNIEIAVRMLRKLSLRLRDAETQIEELELGGRMPPPAQVRAAASLPTKVPTGARLEVEEHGAVFSLNGSETLIGRYDPVTNQRPDIDLTPVDLKRSVSRRHARIMQSPEGYGITEEVGALNGTFVNGTKLVTGRTHPLNDGDRISLGMVRLVFRT